MGLLSHEKRRVKETNFRTIWHSFKIDLPVRKEAYTRDLLSHKKKSALPLSDLRV